MSWALALTVFKGWQLVHDFADNCFPVLNSHPKLDVTVIDFIEWSHAVLACFGIKQPNVAILGKLLIWESSVLSSVFPASCDDGCSPRGSYKFSEPFYCPVRLCIPDVYVLQLVLHPNCHATCNCKRIRVFLAPVVEQAERIAKHAETEYCLTMCMTLHSYIKK